ncbi:hypothetical protein HML84_14985 [Alcanivorax sp. IO_7]|nr:hypothetical protein HML84_14985 [Alcanivorax sp. IO_7]
MDTLYATPVDQQCWPAFLEQLVRISRSRSARMLVLDRAAEQVTSSAKINIDDGAHRQYVDYFVNACPWRPELREKPRAPVLHLPGLFLPPKAVLRHRILQ